VVGRFLLLSLVGEASNLENPYPFIPGMGPNSEDVLWQRGPSDFEGFNSLGVYPQCVTTNPMHGSN
jgi:hypothetical protein